MKSPVWGTEELKLVLTGPMRFSSLFEHGPKAACNPLSDAFSPLGAGWGHAGASMNNPTHANRLSYLLIWFFSPKTILCCCCYSAMQLSIPSWSCSPASSPGPFYITLPGGTNVLEDHSGHAFCQSQAGSISDISDMICSWITVNQEKTSSF